MVKKTDILILGQGIGGLAAFYQLKNLKLTQKLSCLCIENQNEFPSAGADSPIVVAKRGVRKGISALGDILFSSFEKASLVYEEFLGQGVENCFQYIGIDLNDVSWKDRFSHLDPSEFKSEFFENVLREDAFLIYPFEFKKEIQGNFSEKFFYTDWILSIEKKSDRYLVKGVNQTYETNILIDARGWGGFHDGEVKSRLRSQVQGSFLRLFKPKLFNESFVLKTRTGQLVWRSKTEEIIISGFSEASDLFLSLSSKKHEKAFERFDEIFSLEEKAVKYSDFSLETMVRSKGLKRMPILGEEVFPGYFLINGLYKDGWTTAWTAADNIGQNILK